MKSKLLSTTDQTTHTSHGDNSPLRYIFPLLRTAQSKFQTPIRSFSQICDEEIEIAKGETMPCQDAIYIEDDLQKIFGLAPHINDIAQAVNEIQRREVQTNPLLMYKLRNCVIHGGNLFTKRGKYGLLRKRSKEICTRVESEVEHCALGWHSNADTFFGTWLRQIPITMLLANDIGDTIAPQREPYWHQPDYEKLLSISYRSVKSAVIQELVAFNTPYNAFTRTLAHKIRGILAEQFPPDRRRLVYIRRGSSGNTRVLANELNVEQVLRERGFSVMDPGVLSAKEIATQLSGASLVAGVEGSHMSHALYLMSDSGCFINIQPPSRFNTEHKLFADWIGYRYGFVVGTQTEKSAFTVSIDDLLAVIDRASRLHDV